MYQALPQDVRDKYGYEYDLMELLTGAPFPLQRAE